MVADKNNMHGDVDTWMFFKWMFKTACAVIIVTNTWNIVMGVFDVGQSVVNSAAGIINADASIDINSIVVDLEDRLMDMDIGPLFGLWFQSLFVGICTWALTICIFIITYGRMIEIYRASRSAACNPQAVCGHLGIRLWQAGKEKYQRREKRHFSVSRFTPEGNRKGDNSVPETSQVGETIYPRLSGKTQHCE